VRYVKDDPKFRILFPKVIAMENCYKSHARTEADKIIQCHHYHMPIFRQQIFEIRSCDKLFPTEFVRNFDEPAFGG